MNELRDVEAQLVPLDSLKAYDGNAKRHDSDNIDAIANSISEFGFRSPILAWHNEDGVPEIVAGHGRAAAAKKLRMEQVPVIYEQHASRRDRLGRVWRQRHERRRVRADR